MNEQDPIPPTADNGSPQKQTYYKNLSAAVMGLTLPLGDDCPNLYPVKRWVELAETFAQRRQWEHAAACWEQARRLGGTPDEVALYELELEDCRQQPAREAAAAARIAELKRAVPVYDVQDYLAQLEPQFQEGVREALEEIKRVHFEFHDTKGDRVPFAWKNHGEGERLVELENLDLRGKHLIQIGISPQVLERLACGAKIPIDPQQTFWDWAEIRCGSHRLWGDKMKLTFIDPQNPTVIYSPFPTHV